MLYQHIHCWNIPKVLEYLDSYISRAWGILGWKDGEQIGKDSLYTLSKALYLFPSPTEISSG